MKIYDTIIIGGGLAGLTACIQLAKQNLKVLVFEKNLYPHHKVCGEYVSNEVLPYLDYLGVSINLTNTVSINTLQLSTKKGKSMKIGLPMGGIGLSRYAFDHLLYQKALSVGVSFIFESVTTVVYNDTYFEITTASEKTFKALFVLGTYGKRAVLDKSLQRDFIHKKSPWLAVKAHYKLDTFPRDTVALHNFRGGYAGLSVIETGAVNFCYLVSYKSFRQEKDIERFNANVVAQNPFLKTFLENAIPLFKEPMSIAQISFHQKQAVENHMLMCGDTAGLIHPLCGNGMAMAIHSAKIAADLLISHFKNKQVTRTALEKEYTRQWNEAFKQRLWMGRQLQRVLINENLSNSTMTLLAKSPVLVRSIIKKTHGTSIL